MRPDLNRVVLFTLVLSLFVQPAARADVTRFDLSGVVTDSSEAVLPGVTVTIRNVDTGFSRTGTTDAEGRYSFNAPPPTGRRLIRWSAVRSDTSAHAVSCRTMGR